MQGCGPGLRVCELLKAIALVGFAVVVVVRVSVEVSCGAVGYGRQIKLLLHSVGLNELVCNFRARVRDG